ncbi:hypothetical protein PROFUN_09479 [Planoprotostelium fungivorum]|uniref:C3H1-type domain-containing protein n=1 Tax=Planoprotostelium fungivorum TaxID=1890364 RepID=A0A2P6NH48_9EUKA|nr:hypothetical protein PROFUN_09479 [Planoprotostelium fungivorum]
MRAYRNYKLDVLYSNRDRELPNCLSSFQPKIIQQTRSHQIAPQTTRQAMEKGEPPIFSQIILPTVTHTRQRFSDYTRTDPLTVAICHYLNIRVEKLLSWKSSTTVGEKLRDRDVAFMIWLVITERLLLNERCREWRGNSSFSQVSTRLMEQLKDNAKKAEKPQSATNRLDDDKKTTILWVDGDNVADVLEDERLHRYIKSKNSRLWVVYMQQKDRLLPYSLFRLFHSKQDRFIACSPQTTGRDCVDVSIMSQMMQLHWNLPIHIRFCFISRDHFAAQTIENLRAIPKDGQLRECLHINPNQHHEISETEELLKGRKFKFWDQYLGERPSRQHSVLVHENNLFQLLQDKMGNAIAEHREIHVAAFISSIKKPHSSKPILVVDNVTIASLYRNSDLEIVVGKDNLGLNFERHTTLTIVESIDASMCEEWTDMLLEHEELKLHVWCTAEANVGALQNMKVVFGRRLQVFDLREKIDRYRPPALIQKRYTEPCRMEFACQYGDSCSFYHTKDHKLFFEANGGVGQKHYKIKSCARKTCSYQDEPVKCKFSHSIDDLRCYDFRPSACHHGQPCGGQMTHPPLELPEEHKQASADLPLSKRETSTARDALKFEQFDMKAVGEGSIPDFIKHFALQMEVLEGNCGLDSEHNVLYFKSLGMNDFPSETNVKGVKVRISKINRCKIYVRADDIKLDVDSILQALRSSLSDADYSLCDWNPTRLPDDLIEMNVTDTVLKILLQMRVIYHKRKRVVFYETIVSQSRPVSSPAVISITHGHVQIGGL